MDGSVDKNTELRSALCYFVDEAIGYRHSIHFFHRWLETKNQSELEGLILEIGREHFTDLNPLLETVKDPSNNAGILKLHEHIKIHGLYTLLEDTTRWPKHIAPPPVLDDSIADAIEGNTWARYNWIEQNTYYRMNPYFVMAMAMKHLRDAHTDFMKIFDVLEMMFGTDTTLFSCVKNNDIPLLGRMLAQYYPAQEVHINRLAESVNSHQELNWTDALSRNQVKSKLWLIEKMSELGMYPKLRKVTDSTTNVLLVGGWVGMLPFLADMKGKYLDTVINVDIDTTVHVAAQELNSVTQSALKVSGADVRKLNIKQYSNPIVIDTIVEHFEKHGEWVKTLPPGTKVVLQGNDMFHVPDHVNCHKTLEEFVESCGLNNIVWAGELSLYKCTRYMAIGTT